MKYLSLLAFVAFVCVVMGMSETDNHHLSIEGPPPQDGLPEVYYGDPIHPVSAHREILDSKLPERTLIYNFRLPPGTYDHLFWIGHGVPLPSSVAICDYWGREVTTLAPAAESTDLITPTHGPVLLRTAGAISLLRWSLVNGWFWALAVILFFTLRAPVGAVLGRGLNLLSDRLRPGIFEGRTVLLTILSLAPVWLCFILPGAIRFDVGDDSAMELLACGDVTGHPSEYLFFINVLIGFFLKVLYLLVAQVPWYPLLLLAVVIFSLAGITFLFLQDDLRGRFGWLCLVGVVFGTYFVTHLQFTSAAYLVGLFGMLIFTERSSRASFLVATLFVTTGSLIRFDAFLLLLVTTSGAAWLLSRRPAREKVLFFLAVLFLGSSGKAFNHWYIDRDSDWQAYQAYGTARGNLHDSARLNYSQENSLVYKRIGWSENDYKMFYVHWLYEDGAAFSAANLAYLDANLTGNRTPLAILLQILFAISSAPIPVLLLVVILFRSTENPKLSPLIQIFSLGPLLFVAIYLAMTAHLPMRVFVPVTFASSLFLLIAVHKNGEACRRLSSTLFLPLIFVTLTVLSIKTVWIEANQNDLATKRILHSLELLRPYADQTTFVSTINSVLLEQLSPFSALRETRNLDFIHLMWSGGSPSFAAQLQRHHSASLFQSIADDPRFWLIIPNTQWARADCFSLYMQEHYHQNIKMTPVILSDGKPAVFPDFTVMKAVHP